MKTGILTLNEGSVFKNASRWSHDPSMMWDSVTKKYYSYGTDIYMPEDGLNDKIGIPVRSSEDLVHFQYEGTVLSKEAIEEGRENGEYPQTVNFWAPYVEYTHGEYRMYYSATKAFGSSESRIWLAVSKHPLGPFENRGIAADTWGTDDTLPNAIDAHIIWDKEKCYLVYGSFFGGIYIKELDAKTGLPLSGNAKELGICISRKAKHPLIDGPEGASVIYGSETGYFYLFQSYGWLGDTYDIRVGRSKSVTGPYLDWHGKSLVEEGMGLKLAGSYEFLAENPRAGEEKTDWEWGGFRGPGHGVPFYDEQSGKYYFVHHVRDGAEINRVYDEKEDRNSYQIHYMMIRPMFFVNDWPAFGAEPYQGENFEPVSKMDMEKLEGDWELIVFDEFDNSMKHSEICTLEKDSVYFQNGIIYQCQDIENQKEVYIVTGIDNLGLAYWGKTVV